MIADIATFVLVVVAPLFGRHAEQGYIQNVGLRCINQSCVCLGGAMRNEVLRNGVGMDAVVDLGQRPGKVPLQRTTADLFRL